MGNSPISSELSTYPQPKASLCVVLLSFPLYTLAKAIRLAEELQDVGVMSESIEQRGRQLLIAEDLGPVVKQNID